MQSQRYARDVELVHGSHCCTTRVKANYVFVKGAKRAWRRTDRVAAQTAAEQSVSRFTRETSARGSKTRT